MPRAKKLAPRRPLKQQSLLGYLEQAQSDPPAISSSVAESPSPPRRPAPRKAVQDLPSPRRPRLSKKRHVRKSGNTTSSDSDVEAIAFESQTVSDEDDALQSPRRPTTTQRRVTKLSTESEDKNTEDKQSSSEEEIVVSNSKGKAPEKRKFMVVSSDSDDEPPVRRKKLVKGVRPPSPEVHSDDLMDEVESERIIGSRFRSRNKKSTFAQNLEKLKNRKLKKVEVESESESQEEDEDEETFNPFPGAKLHKHGASDASDTDEEDENLGGFIEEDNNAVVPDLPTEFSMNTFQDLTHHFKIICQLFVHLACQPADNRQSFMEQTLKDTYFAVPLQIARRKLTGMRDSIVTSSLWKPSFKKVLEAYPEIEMVQMEYGNPGCDACHLSSRISTIIGRVSGDKYNRKTFEPSDPDESDDDSADEEAVKKEFELGRFCARRTRVFHRFTHWEYSLFKALSSEVQDLQHRSTKRNKFVPVAYAGGTKPPDDLTDADGIMNWLDERGLITREWMLLKEMMDSATNLESASKRGDDDG